MARFNIELTAEIEVDEAVLKEALSAEFREAFYDLRTRDHVAGHLFYNLIRGVELPSLDGFADMPRDAAKIVRDSIDIHGVELRDAPVTKPKKPAAKKRRRA